jgi:hypothetical protein
VCVIIYIISVERLSINFAREQIMSVEAHKQDIKEIYDVDGNENAEEVFSVLEEILGDDTDGIMAMMDDAEWLGLF